MGTIVQPDGAVTLLEALQANLERFRTLRA
jgi:hypothetical protein